MGKIFDINKFRNQQLDNINKQNMGIFYTGFNAKEKEELRQEMISRLTNKQKILVNVWGYSMTLVDFYKVIRETTHSLFVEEIARDEVYDGHLEGYATPNPNKPLDVKIQTYRVSKKGDHMSCSFNREFMSHPVVWDGKPKRFNYCD